MEQAAELREQRKRVLRALDYDLPLLATRAAIEIDRLISGNDIGSRNIQELSALLKNSGLVNASAQRQYLMDPGTLSVLNQAITHTDNTFAETSVEALVNKALTIAEELSMPTTAGHRNGNLEKLKKFCLALSELAASYRQSVLGEETHEPRNA